MNQERLTELKDRAKRATELANKIETLNSYAPGGVYIKVTQRVEGTVLDDALSGAVYRLGHAAMLRELEAELEGILNPPVLESSMEAAVASRAMDTLSRIGGVKP